MPADRDSLGRTWTPEGHREMLGNNEREAEQARRGAAARPPARVKQAGVSDPRDAIRRGAQNFPFDPGGGGKPPMTPHL